MGVLRAGNREEETGGGSLHPPTAETVEKKMHYVHQDGQAVYKFAVRKMAEATEMVLNQIGRAHV